MFLVNRASDGGGCERKDTVCVHICGEGNILINKGVYALGCWELESLGGKGLRIRPSNGAASKF